MKIIGYHIDQDIICNSDGECLTKPDNIPDKKLAGYWLEFLLQYKPDSYKVLYRANYSIAKLCRMLKVGPQSGKKLYTTGKLDMSPEHYQIRWMDNKFISVKGTDDKFDSFADMYQYHKEELDDWQTKDSCIQKAKRAQEIGQSVYQALRKIGIAPATLTSPIRAYEKALLQQLNLPTIDDLPDEVAEWAYTCTYGGWMEAFVLGYWENAFDYDITSAYSHQLAQLLDTRLGFWLDYDKLVTRANIGLLKGEITIWSDFSPVMYDANASRVYTPKDTWETVITLDEYKFIRKWDIGDFKVEKGWFWIPERKSKILHYIIKHLNGVKESSAGIDRETAKRVANGIWGKVGEYHADKKEFGPMYNPVWVSLVESRNKLQVADMCMRAKQIGIEPLHIAVDGVITDKPLPDDWLGTGLGSWHLNTHGKCLIVSSGIVGIEGKGSSEQDFTISYDRLSGLILGGLSADKYIMSKKSFISLGRAVNEDKWDMVGDSVLLDRTISVTGEYKRYYPVEPVCGSDLLEHQYKSEAWPVEILQVEDSIVNLEV